MRSHRHVSITGIGTSPLDLSTGFRITAKMSSSLPRLSPIFPTINVGSYTGSAPVGTPPIHSLARTPNAISQEGFHSARSSRNNTPLSFHSNYSGSSQPIGEEDHASERDVTNEQPQPASEHKPPLCANPRRVATLVILVLGNISSAMFYSLLAPFFPTQAARKGASLYEVGIIFGLFQVVQFIMAPVFGYYMTKLGSKYLFVAGNFVCSACAILFGLLEWCPDGALYFVMCVVTRSVEAVGSAAQNTATFAIGAYTFPHHISIVMGLLQAASCIGLMSGPPVGGLLYSEGGFYLPFVVTGGLFMFFSLVSYCFLPSPDKEPHRPAASLSSKLRLLRAPIVPIIGFLVFVAQATIGFIDVALAKYLQELQPDMSTVTVGLIFLVPAGLVVLTAPIFGLITDKHKSLGRPFILFGTLAGGLGFLGVGPSPLLHFLPSVSVTSVLVALAVSALGWGSLVVTYQEYITAARRHGFPEGLETQGIISGINGAFNSLGALLGPTVGGVLYEQIHFPWASTIIGGAVLLAGFILLVYIILEAIFCPYRELREETTGQPPIDPDERTPLITG